MIFLAGVSIQVGRSDRSRMSKIVQLASDEAHTLSMACGAARQLANEISKHIDEPVELRQVVRSESRFLALYEFDQILLCPVVVLDDCRLERAAYELATLVHKRREWRFAEARVRFRRDDLARMVGPPLDEQLRAFDQGLARVLEVDRRGVRVVVSARARVEGHVSFRNLRRLNSVALSL